MTVTRRWYFNRKPSRDLEADTLQLREDRLPEPQEGEVSHHPRFFREAW